MCRLLRKEYDKTSKRKQNKVVASKNIYAEMIDYFRIKYKFHPPSAGTYLMPVKFLKKTTNRTKSVPIQDKIECYLNLKYLAVEVNDDEDVDYSDYD